MGRAEARADFSGALSAIVVVALIMATTAVMVVTLNTARAGGESAGISCSVPAGCEAQAGGAIALSLLTK